jgi:hypothetical protein
MVSKAVSPKRAMMMPWAVMAVLGMNDLQKI